MAGGRSSAIIDKPAKAWMTSGEVARALNMTDAAIRRWAREGLIEAIKTPGGQYRFRREALTSVLQGKHHQREPSRNGGRSGRPKRR